MRSRSDIVQRLTQAGIIAVVRTDQAAQVAPICEALLAGGVRVLEITLTVPDALNSIRAAAEKHSGSGALVGAGTVLDAVAARAAIGAGAEFVVSPITRIEIIAAAHAFECPVMIGAYTPTEAQSAHEAGADFIKIFPADKLGPSYIKSLRAPLPHLKIVPTGGVDLQTATDFLKAGCVALGVGGSLLTAEILRTNNWAELTRLSRAYVELFKGIRG